jgi:hypothetical protein
MLENINTSIVKSNFDFILWKSEFLKDREERRRKQLETNGKNECRDALCDENGFPIETLGNDGVREAIGNDGVGDL